MRLEVLRLMRDATAAGVITWAVSESGDNGRRFDGSTVSFGIRG
jgi:hypothetical protein